MQFTVNGQFQPELKLKPGQTEIWVLANVSDFAYMPVTTHRDRDGQPTRRSRSSGRTATPSPRCSRRSTGTAPGSIIPPASRYAIAVTMPETGDLVLDMPPKEGAQPVIEPRGAVHQRRHREPARRAGHGHRRPARHQLHRRLLHLPDPDPAARHPRQRRRAGRRPSSPARTSTPTPLSWTPR